MAAITGFRAIGETRILRTQTSLRCSPDWPVTRLPNWRSTQFCCSRGLRWRVPTWI